MEQISEEKQKCLESNACLSDVEDISDIEVEDAVHKLHKTITCTQTYSERSIFNITLENVKMGVAVSNIDNDIDAYSLRVAKEKQNWVDFVSTVRPCAESEHDRKAAGAPAPYKPSVEQQNYLSKSPDLQKFIRDSKAFMTECNEFLAECEKMQELQLDLQEICQSYSSRMARHAAAEQLAKQSEI